MNPEVRELVRSVEFDRRWRRLGLGDRDWEALRAQLVRQPRIGAVIPGAGGVRKMRFAPPTWHRGKSGAARVVYLFVEVRGVVYLLAVYAKNEQTDLTAAEVRALRTAAQRLKGS